MSSISLNVTEPQVVGADYSSGSSSRGSFQLLFCLAFFKNKNAIIIVSRGRGLENDNSVATWINWTDWMREKLKQA